MTWGDLHILENPLKERIRGAEICDGENNNCLDGEEDGDAPEKGSDGGGRPAHTGKNLCISKR